MTKKTSCHEKARHAFIFFDCYAPLRYRAEQSGAERSNRSVTERSNLIENFCSNPLHKPLRSLILPISGLRFNTFCIIVNFCTLGDAKISDMHTALTIEQEKFVNKGI
jgi:hypothetical protein